MRPTGIIRKIDPLGRLVVPMELRRYLKIREGDPTLTTLTPTEQFCFAILALAKRVGIS